MLNSIEDFLKADKTKWPEFSQFFQELEVTPRTILVKEGEVAQNLYFIKSGCLRIWFNNNGKDITTQFFFEGQPVASLESFLGQEPSLFNLESIEKSKLLCITKKHFDILFEHYPELQKGFQQILLKRLTNYANLFLSRIKDNPSTRYSDLIKNHPEVLKRVPQHYIASYLGITPISLSRIRNRKS